MKRRMILKTSVVLLLALGGILATAANAPGMQDSAAAQKAKKKTITGIVQSVNPAANTFVLISKGKEKTFQVAPKALIVINSKLARLRDIKKDASAKVVYSVDRGTRTEMASEIFATQASSQSPKHGKQEDRPIR